jgi:hypothetical protein
MQSRPISALAQPRMSKVRPWSRRGGHPRHVLRVGATLAAIVLAATYVASPASSGARTATTTIARMPGGWAGAGARSASSEDPTADAAGAATAFAIRAARGGGFTATSGGVRATFGAAETTVTAGAGARLRLGLLGIGRATLRPAANADARRVAANTVQYISGGGSRTSYITGAYGVEQRFEIDRRPAGLGWLTVEAGRIAVGERAWVERSGAGVVIASQRRSPAVALSYSKLHVTDAQGRVLPARISVRRGQILVYVNDSHARYPIEIDPLVQEDEIDGGSGDALGSATAIEGSILVIGAPATTINGNAGQGEVFVYTDSSAGWQLAAELTATDGAAGDGLGASVAIDGTTVVAGAPHHAVGGTAVAGAVYAFTPSDGSWQTGAQAELTAGSPSAGDDLGTAVAISGSTIAAGAPGHASASGAVFTFSQATAGSWEAPIQATLAEPGQQAGDMLGSSVALDGSSLIAGAPGRQVAGSSGEGAAYAWTATDGSWSGLVPTELTEPSGAAGDAFGSAAAIANGTAVIGAPDASGGGAADVFTQNGVSWQAAATLRAPDAATGDTFGAAVATSGTVVVIGAPDDDGGASDAGSAYAFTEPSGATWGSATSTELTAQDAEAGSLLGSSVGVSGIVYVAGAPDRTGESGATYVFGPGGQAAPEATSPPTISGTPLVGDTLAESHGVWSNSPIAYSYQWDDCDATGGACIPIAGATEQTYTLGSGDVGHTVVVEETAANAAGVGGPTSSAPSSVVDSAPTLTLPPHQVTVGANGATLSGSVTPGGLATNAQFEYGLDPSYSGASTVTYTNATATITLAAGFTPQTVTASVSGLVPNATYHVRLVATNSAGTTVGPDQTFTTGAAPPPAPPQVGQSVDLTPVSGTVLYKPPSSTSAAVRSMIFQIDSVETDAGFIPLTEATRIPIGSEIDARHGRLKLVAAGSKADSRTTAFFGGSLFTVREGRRGRNRGITTLSLLEGAFGGAPSFDECPSKTSTLFVHADIASKRIVESLTAQTHGGGFETVGRYSTATSQRAASWTTVDRCDGTLTRVTHGTVSIHDTVTKKTVVVRAGHSYLSEAPTTTGVVVKRQVGVSPTLPVSRLSISRPQPPLARSWK